MSSLACGEGDPESDVGEVLADADTARLLLRAEARRIPLPFRTEGASRPEPAFLEHGRFCRSSRRFPSGVFDGELIAFSEGQPDFLVLTDRMLLTRDLSIPIAFVAFDVLSLDGENIMHRPYWQRRELLEGLQLAGSHWCITPSFDDGEALWAVVERDELEGGVAKPLSSTYKPAERRSWPESEEPRVLEVRVREAGWSYFPREVFFFGFGFGLPLVFVAAACRFCFFDAM